jgi:hypothetical protein
MPRDTTNRPSERTESMKHNLCISVSKKPENGGIVRCQRRTIRERLLRCLLGEKRSVTVIVPGDTVECVSITELSDGGDITNET